MRRIKRLVARSTAHPILLSCKSFASLRVCTPDHPGRKEDQGLADLLQQGAGGLKCSDVDGATLVVGFAAKKYVSVILLAEYAPEGCEGGIMG